jgi:HEAT repeat protein
MHTRSTAEFFRTLLLANAIFLIPVLVQARGPETRPIDSLLIEDLLPKEFSMIESHTRAKVLGNIAKSTDALVINIDGGGYRAEMVLNVGFGPLSLSTGSGTMFVVVFPPVKTSGGKISLESQKLLNLFWFRGAEHTFFGKATLKEYSFESDPAFPLVFKVVPARSGSRPGYMYLCGRGTVTKDGKDPVRLGYDQTVKDWVSTLKSGTQLRREGAAQALGWIGDSSCLPILIKSLKDSSQPIRRNAAESLGRLGGRREVAEALSDAIRSKDSSIGLVAVESLGKMKEAGFPYLLAMLAPDDENKKVRTLAIHGLGESQLDAAVPHLHRVFNDKVDANRKEALQALITFGPSNAIGPSLQALKDSDKSMREAGIKASLALGDHRALPILETLAQEDTDKKIKKSASEAITRLSKMHDNTIKEASKAIEEDNTDASSYLRRGEAYTKIGEFDQALSDFTRVIEIADADTKLVAYRRRGDVNRWMRNFTDALADYRKADAPFRVEVLSDETELRLGTESVGTVASGKLLTITDVNEEWLWSRTVMSEVDQEGWVDSSQVR